MLPFRASYGVSFMSTSTEIDRVIKGFYCIWVNSLLFCFHKQPDLYFYFPEQSKSNGFKPYQARVMNILNAIAWAYYKILQMRW